ncbi:DUF2628 domain-containing protein [Psychrilyobacter atlanticus]|uniref:DUF2628 domain-containing protein n=1 Tax=Psychrilyobacter atlanticus TaxID=271091 RepID=UPI00040D3C64|nr:DUF2628 domain-containing protein [Psychrilyobacter atlanticus]
MDKERLISAYIGEKESLEKTKKTLNWYKDSFEKGDLSGGFSWKWSWWAFLGNWLYLLYRKCYLEGISYFLLVHILGGAVSKYMPNLAEMVGGASLFIGLLSGGLLHNLVYRRYLKSKTIIESRSISSEDMENEMKSIGGTDKRAVIIGIIVYFVVNTIFSL